MLAGNQRLNLKTSFSFVVKGQKAENPFYKIFFRSSEEQIPKVGIALKKDYFRLATDRNRARRLTSKALEALYPKLKEKIYLVLMPKTAVLDKSSFQLEEYLEKALTDLNLLKG